MKLRATHQPLRMKTHAGFTLIELLVVISIISLLVAVLLPALAKVRLAAEAAVCMSRQHMIGLALAVYAEDWDRYIIPAVQSTATDSNGLHRYWSSRLASEGDYLPWSVTYFCPDDTRPNPPDLQTWNHRSLVYGMRVWFAPTGPQRDSQPKQITLIKQPSAFFILADSYQLLLDTGWYRHYPSTSTDHRTIYRAHMGAANTLFMDNHVTAINDKKYFQKDIPQTQGEYSGGVGYYVAK